MTSGPAARPTGIHRTRVEWMDTDAAGIYHNSAVMRYIEAAEAALMYERGLAAYFPVAPRVRYEVDFERPLTFGQKVTAVVELAGLGKSSMTFEFEIWGEEFEGRSRRRAAYGRYVTVHIAGSHADGSAHSAPWPQGWTDALTTTTSNRSEGEVPAE